MEGVRMKLNIKNFAKIENADILIDGITVIAGENNTGKSTVGKILFSLFNSLSDIDEKINEERLREIEQTNQVIILNYFSMFDLSRVIAYRQALNKARILKSYFYKQLENNKYIEDKTIYDIVNKVLGDENKVDAPSDKNDRSEMINEVYKNTKEILRLPESIIIQEVVSGFFNNVFHSQIRSLSGTERQDAVITLDIKGKQDTIYFVKNNCKEFTDEINIIHKAIYIDNPFIIDELSKNNELDPMNQMLEKLLFSSYKGETIEGVIEIVRAKEKLSDLTAMLQTVIEGEIITDQNNEFYLRSDNYDEPISFHNLSTGMKSFVILKMLIEKGCLKDKDVLILDEPEIHLHPQWQIAYAELIVLLQKQFDLSVVVTTHSPYFVDALNLFSCKYGTDKKVNYYLSSNHDNTVVMENVTENIDLIYKKMATPIQMLDTLRYELNNN